MMNSGSAGPSLAQDALRAMRRALGVKPPRQPPPSALVDAESPYGLLFECNPHPMWVYDQETLGFLAVNEAAVRHYGYTRDEFLSMSIQDIRPPEDPPVLLENLERHQKKDGTLIEVEVTAHDLLFVSRRARLVFAADVTERRHAELALKRGLAEARSMVEVMRAITASLDTHAVLDLIVERARLLLGSERSSLAVVAPEWSDAVITFIAQRGLSEQFTERTRPLHWKDGTTATSIYERRPVWTADILADPMVDLTPSTRAIVQAEGFRAVLSVPLLAGDRVLGALAIYRDAPGPFSREEVELLQACAAQAATAMENARLYAESERRRRAAESLAAVSGLISQSLDLDNVAHSVVESVCALLGASKSTLYQMAPNGQDLELLASTGQSGEPPLIVPRVTAAAGPAVSEGRPVTTPDVLADPRIALTPEVRAGIERSPYRAVLAVPLVVQARVVGVLVVGDHARRRFDDEDRRVAQVFADQAAIALENARLYAEVQRQLRQRELAQAQLLQAAKLAAVGQLIGGVAHELNNPLSVVVGHAQLLAQKSTDPLVLNRASNILAGARRATRIVQELLNFARPRTPELSVVNVTDAVERVLSLREHTLQVNGITVVRRFEAEMPLVLGDALKLDQVFLNLLLNAEHATREADASTIVISLSTVGECVRLAISDQGRGIPPDVLPRIFEPFFTTKPLGQGTGLGLSICYSIVEAHGGRIWAESEPGRGATMLVDLPVYTRPPVAELASRTPGLPHPLRRGRVLVVDDEPDVAGTLRALLEYLGQEVTVAPGGDEGWVRLSEPDAAYDLVTLDLKMPGISGQKLWEMLTADRSPATERIVFITGDTVEAGTRAFLEATGRPVLHKPVDPDALVAILAEQFARAER